MKNKEYRRPCMTIIELRQKTILLTSPNGGEATRKGYGKANSQLWEDSDE